MTYVALVRVQRLTSACLLNGKGAVPLRFHVLRGNGGVRADRTERAHCNRDKTGSKHQLDLHANLARVNLGHALGQDQKLIRQLTLAQRRARRVSVPWWTAR